MSGNSNNPQFDPVENEEQIEENIDKPENPSQPAMSKNQGSCPENASESESTTEEEERERENILEGIKNEEEQTDDKAKNISANKSEKQIVADDDQDGFKTPTSSEHRIPAITECPPAPRKPHPSKWKRRRSPQPEARRRMEFDALEEVESLFRPVPDIDDEDNGKVPKNKKLRRDDDDEEEEEEDRA